MDSYSSIVDTYERVMSLVEKGNYHFHIKGIDISYGNITYDEFITHLPNIEYIDDDSPDYNRTYLNPFTRNILLVCARKQYADNKLILIRVPMSLVNTVYTLMEDGVRSEYQSTLSIISRKLMDFGNPDDSDEIQKISGGGIPDEVEDDRY